MQQRQLRLGDIIDDYCPRERRLTNHAVVAMVGDEVKQTRCTTCDAEHPYKRAKVPVSRQRKEAASEAYRAVLASVQQEGAAMVARVADAPSEPVDAAPPDAAASAIEAAPAVNPGVASRSEQRAVASRPAARAARSAVVERTVDARATRPVPPADPAPEAAPPSTSPRIEESAAQDDRSAEPGHESEGVAADEARVHRRLIRAQLPRTEGKEPTPRPIPQFTIHDARAAAFRGRGHQRGSGGGNRQGQGGRNPFGRDAGGRGAFSQRPSKSADASRRQRSGGRPHKPGKKHSK